MAESDRTESLRAIRDAVIALKASPLYAYRTENKYLPVIGEGSHFAEVMLIGEAPGRNEAETGRPFCGASGKVLDELLSQAGIDRKDIYITNIVKDRPPANRDPLPEEIEAYGSFLDQQIDIIQPKVLATLGRYSMQYIMNKFGLGLQLDVISKMHGKVFDAEASYGPIKIVPLFHPAVAVYDNSKKPILVEDFKIINTVIKK